MAKISALTALARADVLDTDYIVVVDASAGVTKRMDIDSLLGALDGDQLDIDYTPTNYTPDAATPAEADDVDDLTAHLYGIDQKLNEIDNYGIEQADTTFTVSSTGHYIEIDTSGGAVTATLPSAATLGAGWQYMFKITDATAGTTLATNGAETIEGAGAWSLNQANETLSIISDGTNWKLLAWDHKKIKRRPQCSYATATSFTVGEFAMDTPTCEFPTCYVNTDLTLYGSSGGGGSNASNTDLDTTGWFYVYIDASVVASANSPLLTAASFLLSTDAPDYDTTYGLWLGDATSNTTTSDICIFAFRVHAASTIMKWYHDGSRHVQYDSEWAILSAPAATTWQTQVVHVPLLACRAELTMYVFSSVAGASTTVYVRQGSSSATGYVFGVCAYDGAGNPVRSVNSGIVYTDISGQVDYKVTVSANVSMYFYSIGYYLPRGM